MVTKTEKTTTRLSLQESAKEKLSFAIDKLISNTIEDKPAISRKDRSLGTQQDLKRSYARLRDAASVLNHWHSRAEYLTENGDPKALPMTGKVSLSSLISGATGSRRGSRKILKDMADFGLIEKFKEGYRPNKRSAVYGSKSPIMLAHAATAIDRLVETIAHNVSGAPLPRYERQVAAVTIAERELPQFLRFVEQQGQYFIDSIDDWLAGREISKASKAHSVSVGVGAYAWTESAPNRVKPRRKSSSPSTRSRR